MSAGETRLCRKCRWEKPLEQFHTSFVKRARTTASDWKGSEVEHKTMRRVCKACFNGARRKAA